MRTHSCTTARVAVLVAALVSLSVLPAAAQDEGAQGFISPLIGFNFGGDSGCPELTDCEDKRVNAGVTLGVLGDVFGFEEEFAYASNFFGETPGVSNSVLTVMTNVMLVPNVGPVRPYAVVGLGLIKTHVELSPESVLNADNNHFGWNLGGGLFIFFGDHVGIRGDIRYFHAFKELEVLGIDLGGGGTKLDFGRASAAVVFIF